MLKSNNLPFYSAKNANRIKSKLLNEKSLIFLLLVISLITILIILMNLPSDIQRIQFKKELHDVFVPGFEKQINHEEFHQHPAPPIYKDKSDPVNFGQEIVNIEKTTVVTSSSITSLKDKSEMIKKVNTFLEI